jgi:hypothetical protein
MRSIRHVQQVRENLLRFQKQNKATKGRNYEEASRPSCKYCHVLVMVGEWGSVLGE